MPYRGTMVFQFLRFGFALAFIFQGMAARGHYKLIEGHHELQVALDGRPFAGENIARVPGFFGFSWSIVMCLPFLDGPILIIPGVIDVGIAIAVAVVASVQSSYIPNSKSRCSHLPTDHRFNHTLSFYALAGRLNGTHVSGEVMCKDFFDEWVIGVATAPPYMLFALALIWFGIRSLRDRKDRGRHRRHVHRCPSLRPKEVFHFFYAIFTTVVGYISRLVPSPVKACFAFCFLRIPKRHQKMSTFTELELRQPRPYTRHPKKVESDGSDIFLAKLLCYDILVLLAGNLHYVDLVNLSLVSKRLRQAVFPLHGTEGLDDRGLRLYSCEGPEKSECWTCGIQICHICRSTRMCLDSRASFHSRLCNVHCTECFFKHMCNPKYPGQCSCRDARSGVQWTSSLSVDCNIRRQSHVCSTCDELDNTSLEGLREIHDKAELKRWSKQPLTCSKCKRLLRPNGPRWWLCSKCCRECVSDVHHQWAPKPAV